MGLQEGDIVTKRALCVGMLLPSGNDAANAAAVKIAGSIGKFADMMNERAEELGMSRTYFVTPSGLEGEGHGSSAYDMAILAREALKNDDFREICSSKTIQLRYGNPPYDRTLTNTNKLLSMYQGVYGVKTGFTDEAGRCLVSACERDGINLICVTLNDGNDWNDHMALYDYGFSKAELISPELPDTFEMNVVGGTDDKIMLQPDSGFTVTAVNDDSSLYSYRVLSSPFVYAPVEEGEQLAELQVMYGEREVCRIPLYAVNEVVRTAENNTENNIFKKLLLWLKKIFMR
jgi:D-alanyl-D-alanine carboxypeptidase/D-alanyl-D-alanine carboxypeptidase (penicillin-binding protein 5/6)